MCQWTKFGRMQPENGPEFFSSAKQSEMYHYEKESLLCNLEKIIKLKRLELWIVLWKIMVVGLVGKWSKQFKLYIKGKKPYHEWLFVYLCKIFTKDGKMVEGCLRYVKTGRKIVGSVWSFKGLNIRRSENDWILMYVSAPLVTWKWGWAC